MTRCSNPWAVFLPVACSLVLAASEGIRAQGSYVWPPGYASTPGNSAQGLPFSVSPNHTPLGSRSTVLLTAQYLQPLVNRTLTAIAFRRDRQHGGSYAAASGIVEVRIGPVTSALSLGRSPTEVFSSESTRAKRGSLVVPGASFPSGAAPFSAVIDFDEPYTYTGGDLAIDVTFTTSAPVTWRRDAVWVDPGVGAQVQTLGSGAAGSGGLTPITAVEAGSFHPGGELITRVEALSLPAGQPLAQLFGLVSAPTPLAVYGLPPGTELHLQSFTSLPGVSADRSVYFARATASVSVPNLASLVGTVIGTQWLALDPALPVAVPLNLTNGLQLEVAAAPAATSDWGRTLWARGCRIGDAHLASEIGPIDYVPVIEFRW